MARSDLSWINRNKVLSNGDSWLRRARLVALKSTSKRPESPRKRRKTVDEARRMVYETRRELERRGLEVPEPAWE